MPKQHIETTLYVMTPVGFETFSADKPLQPGQARACAARHRTRVEARHVTYTEEGGDIHVVNTRTTLLPQ